MSYEGRQTDGRTFKMHFWFATFFTSADWLQPSKPRI